jgi:hypothetical protein
MSFDRLCTGRFKTNELPAAYPGSSRLERELGSAGRAALDSRATAGGFHGNRSANSFGLVPPKSRPYISLIAFLRSSASMLITQRRSRSSSAPSLAALLAPMAFI